MAVQAGTVMGGTVDDNGSDLLRREQTRVHHLVEGAIGAKLRIQRILRDRDMERLLHSRNGRQERRLQVTAPERARESARWQE